MSFRTYTLAPQETMVVDTLFSNRFHEEDSCGSRKRLFSVCDEEDSPPKKSRTDIESSSTTADETTKLHDEMLLSIFSFLDHPSSIAVRFVCNRWSLLGSYSKREANENNSCTLCAELGYTTLMKWFHKRLKHPWVINVTIQAVRHGHLDVLNYMETVHWMRDFDSVKCHPLMPRCSEMALSACVNSRINVLEWLHSRHAYRFEDFLTDVATDLMNAELLEWLLKHDCKWHFGRRLNEYVKQKHYDKVRWMIDTHEKLFADMKSP
jgi:hypothetical protein